MTIKPELCLKSDLSDETNMNLSLVRVLVLSDFYVCCCSKLKYRNLSVLTVAAGLVKLSQGEVS